LAAASGGSFNLLHVCGTAVNFRAFADYPVHALNWADRAAGPLLGEAAAWAKPALCGGIDNLSTLPNGTPADCRQEVTDALRQARDRPIMIAPGCTYDPQAVPRANLEAICQAVRQ
jgi:uroporphyrinogen decarboxylase